MSSKAAYHFCSGALENTLQRRPRVQGCAATANKPTTTSSQRLNAIYTTLQMALPFPFGQFSDTLCSDRLPSIDNMTMNCWPRHRHLAPHLVPGHFLLKLRKLLQAAL